MVERIQDLVKGIDAWLVADSANYATYFIVMAVIFAVTIGAMLFFRHKIGGKDERTETVDLQISYVTLFAGFIAMAVYVVGISKEIENIQQLVLIPLAVMTTTSAIATLRAYYKTR